MSPFPPPPFFLPLQLLFLPIGEVDSSLYFFFLLRIFLYHLKAGCRYASEKGQVIVAVAFLFFSFLSNWHRWRRPSFLSSLFFFPPRFLPLVPIPRRPDLGNTKETGRRLFLFSFFFPFPISMEKEVKGDLFLPLHLFPFFFLSLTPLFFLHVFLSGLVIEQILLFLLSSKHEGKQDLILSLFPFSCTPF